MSDLRTPLATAIAISLCLAALPTQAQQAPLKMTLFGQPSVNNDSVWMAFEKGLYQQEGLDVTYRLFPSGTTAFQAFQTGQGDIVMTGDLPSVQYFFRAKGDYRTIAVMERDAKGYVAVARKEVTKPQDLVGKTVATRVGSTGSWFISEYLTKNGVDPSKVTIKNSGYPGPACGAVRWRHRGLLHLAAGRITHARDLRGQGALPDRRDRLHPGLPGRGRASRMARQSARQGDRDALAAGDDQRPRHRRKGLRQRRSLCQGQARPEREGHARAVGHQHAPARARQDLLRRLLQSQPLGAGGKNDRAKDRLQSADLARRAQGDQSETDRCAAAAVLSALEHADSV